MSMRILTASDVRRALPMADAIDAMREAFAALADGRVELPLRIHQEIPAAGLTALTMPGVVLGPIQVGAKLLTLNPGNPERNLPVIHGVVVMFDAATGAPAGVLDGAAITALRTGAVCGLATELLARADAHALALVGAGTQARAQFEAVCCVREITTVMVWSRTGQSAERLAREIEGAGTVETVRVVGSPGEAVADADIICTATPATAPLVGLADVGDGVHLNAVGSYTRQMCELGPRLVRSARIVVDSTEAALEEAGELMAAVEEGLVDSDNFIELGEIVNGRDSGRESEDEITLFKSVGLAVQDLSAVARALTRAADEDLGTEVDLGA